jgi:enamine deaminase RidA (YjgF/YER057c/UK114 family)
MTRLLVSSGSPFEAPFGFSRAVRVDDHVFVAGTAPIAPDGSTACPGDPAGQAERCLDIIVAALEEAGASREDVVRTRLLVTDASRWQEVAAVHGRFFGHVRPACTLVEVKGFLDPEWLVEIEADAVLGR